MKIQTAICSFLAAGLFAGCASEKSEHKHHEKEARLRSQAKVSETDARTTALAQVADGTVKECELEKERGKLIWSFDLSTPDSADITEVNVDAISGNVVSVAKEKAGEEAKEKDDKN